MNKIIARLKKIRLAQVLMAFLSAVLLLVSTTACGSKVMANTADNVREEVPGSAVTNQYKGGMNDYSDIDPRKDTTEASAKAKALIDSKERSLINNQEGVLNKDYGKNVRDGAAGVADKTTAGIGEKTKGTAAELKAAAQRGTENIKANASNAFQNAKEGAKEASASNAAKAKGAAEDTKEATDIAGKQFKALGNKLKQNAAETGDSIKSETSKAVDRAID